MWIIILASLSSVVLDNVPLCCQCLLIEVNLVFLQTVAKSRDELVRESYCGRALSGLL